MMTTSISPAAVTKYTNYYSKKKKKKKLLYFV